MVIIFRYKGGVIIVELDGVHKTYNGEDYVVNNLNLVVNKGEILVLVGESGCGKSTTIQMINRLIEPTAGTIKVNGVDVETVDKIELRRNIGYVIQSGGLFPHYTVEENISIVPKLCNKDEKKIKVKVLELMNMIGLDYETYSKRYPNELSGGQRQRVGVARALANDPDVILMDEPFSALDPITREQLQDELVDLNNTLGKTIIVVTHDMDEAIKIGTKIAIIENGKIVQCDKPHKILNNPKNNFVKNFIGSNRVLQNKTILKAEDVMVQNIVAVDSNETVDKAIEEMKNSSTYILVVIEKAEQREKIVGIVESNLLRCCDRDEIIKNIMIKDIIEIENDTPVTEVMSIRETENSSFNLVVNKCGELLGLITNKSIVSMANNIINNNEKEIC